MVEDDIHCMAVTLRHDGERVLKVEPVTERMPWNTCPGAAAKLVETFEGLRLEEVTARRDKKQNCTHLHDMAVLAAAHAHDSAGFSYDIYATDPVDGTRILEICRDGQSLHRWTEQGGILTDPPELSGMTLLGLRDWIATQEGARQEAARVLQWALSGGTWAHDAAGRTIQRGRSAAKLLYISARTRRRCETHGR